MDAQLLRRSAVAAVLLASALLAACGTGRPPQPYAGLQARPIKALPPDKVADLEAGRGTGYALAAELNHYPGPKHVLELASDLALSPDQQQAIAALVPPMESEAKQLGARLVELEAELDRGYASQSITAAELERLTAEIGAVEGRLRRAHLEAHLKTRALLRPEQIARYDQLRGYAATSGTPEPHHGHHLP